jgi:hypothetical protein
LKAIVAIVKIFAHSHNSHNLARHATRRGCGVLRKGLLEFLSRDRDAPVAVSQRVDVVVKHVPLVIVGIQARLLYVQCVDLMLEGAERLELDLVIVQRILDCVAEEGCATRGSYFLQKVGSWCCTLWLVK